MWVPPQDWRSHLIGEGVGEPTGWQRSLLVCQRQSRSAEPELVYSCKVSRKVPSGAHQCGQATAGGQHVDVW